jgi:hypothetical protein
MKRKEEERLKKLQEQGGGIEASTQVKTAA